MRQFVWIVTLLLFATVALARGPAELPDTPAAFVRVAGMLSSIDPATGAEREIFRLEHHALTAPAVLGDTVYVGASDKSVYALDAATGQTRWTYPTGHFVFFVQAREKAVYVGAGPLLLALEPATGKVIWKYEDDVAVNDLVLVDANAVFNSFDGPIAVDQTTGEVRWRVDERWGYFVFSPLAAGRMCIWKPDEIFVVETERGKTLWTTAAKVNQSAPGAIPSPAVGDRSDILCQLRSDAKDAEDWSLYAVEGGSGRELWKQHLDQSEAASPRSTIIGDAVYCTIGRTLHKFHLNSGQPLWTIIVNPVQPRCPITEATVAGGAKALVVPELDGSLLAIDEETGKRLWKIPPATPAEGHAIGIAGVAPSKDAIFVVRNEVARPE